MIWCFPSLDRFLSVVLARNFEGVNRFHVSFHSFIRVLSFTRGVRFVDRHGREYLCSPKEGHAHRCVPHTFFNIPIILMTRYNILYTNGHANIANRHRVQSVLIVHVERSQEGDPLKLDLQ